MKKIIPTLCTVALLTVSGAAQAEDQPVMVPIQRLSLDMALKAAQATIAQCRKEGVQVAVTIVDRGGHAQVVLRDVLAMDLTLPISRDKAYTALSFNTPTKALSERLEHPNSIGKTTGILAAAGGLPITAGGTLIGGIGVSGAPSGITDENCAKAGIDAISADLEMGSF
ncbi:MAG: heme-binding protein [Gammaproteobacteria bacterium]|nr:heme-binding protein [Gammaproteobacteria bacterium]